ncbi:MAG: LptF/LptG family permease [Planctomycetota bacterium]
MPIIQRYLLRELLVNAVVTFVVLGSLIAMLFFSMTALKARMSYLGVNELLTIVWYLCAGRLDVLIPLTAMVACLWTYGRAAAGREIDAMRSSGIGLLSILVPALFLGAVLGAGLVWLQDSFIPDTHYARRLVGRRALSANIDQLLGESEVRIKDERISCTARSGVDAEGHRILVDVIVSEKKTPDSDPVFTMAREAEPRLDPARGELTLHLKGLRHGGVLASDEMTVTLNLGALSEDGPPSRPAQASSYEELFTDIARPRDRKSSLVAQAELHRRFALAAAALAFSFFGATLGILRRTANRALTFTLGFLIVLILGFLPTLAGKNLVASGTLPAGLALWSGDAVTAALGFFLFARIRRR